MGAKSRRRAPAPELERKAEALPRQRRTLRYAVAARERVDNPSGVLAVTAADIFA